MSSPSLSDGGVLEAKQQNHQQNTQNGTTGGNERNNRESSPVATATPEYTRCVDGDDCGATVVEVLGNHGEIYETARVEGGSADDTIQGHHGQGEWWEERLTEHADRILTVIFFFQLESFTSSGKLCHTSRDDRRRIQQTMNR